MTPFISYRLNNAGQEYLDQNHPQAIWVSRFYAEHPEYRIGPDINSRPQHVHNWAYDEVRDHKYAFIEEICENYEIEGFELDFLRFPSFFNLEKTSRDERAAIMTDFSHRIRKLLDRTAVSGRHRWLSIRVPCTIPAQEQLGIDASMMTKAGVDMINLSPSWLTVQQTDMAEIRTAAPDAAMKSRRAWDMGT